MGMLTTANKPVEQLVTPVPPTVTLAPQFDPTMVDESWMPAGDATFGGGFDMSKLWGMENLRGFMSIAA